MTIDAKKLAAVLRDATENSKWQDALLGIADDIEGKYDEPAEHWIGPLEWHGGECPLPPETVFKISTRGGQHNVLWSYNQSLARWSHENKNDDITSFSYLADNPEGWIPRPKGWAPPKGAYPIALRFRRPDVCGDDGLEVSGPHPDGMVKYLDYQDVTHIRLLPREAEPKPAPIPADVRATVREALASAAAICADYKILGHRRDKIRNALDALDAAPPEMEPDDDPVYEWHPRSLYDALDGIAVYGGDTLSGPVKGAPTVAWLRSSVYEMVRRARYAMDHSGPDAAPAEGETVGYGVMDKDLEFPIFAKLYKTSREARENGIFCKSTQRIVKLVEVPDQ